MLVNHSRRAELDLISGCFQELDLFSLPYLSHTEEAPRRYDSALAAQHEHE